MNIDDGTVDAAADSIYSIVQPAYAPAFGGLTVDPTAGVVTVYLTADEGNVRQLITDHVDGVTVLFVTVGLSLQSLEATRDEITADQGWFADSNIDLSSWGVDVTHNQVSVGVNNPSPTQIAAILTRYGADRVRVDSEEYYTEDSTRYDDFAPFFGGDYTHSASAACTAGFGVILANGSRRLVAAGHCGPNGQNWYGGNENPMGFSCGRHYNQNGLVDNMVLCGAAASNYTWGNKNVHPDVSAATRDNYSDQICANGVRTGQVCSVTVVATEKCIYFKRSDHTTCGQTVARNTNKRVVTVSGDSGGPVFSYYGDGDRLQIRGTITGGSACLCQAVYTPAYHIFQQMNLSLYKAS